MWRDSSPTLRLLLCVVARAVSGQIEPDPSGIRRVRLILILICLLAAVRVFVFSAAFPFFNNVDEPSQFDLVVKYSRGEIPCGFTPFAAESAALIPLYSSPEFLLT